LTKAGSAAIDLKEEDIERLRDGDDEKREYFEDASVRRGGGRGGVEAEAVAVDREAVLVLSLILPFPLLPLLAQLPIVTVALALSTGLCCCGVAHSSGR
jgi:hypothetical protein